MSNQSSESAIDPVVAEVLAATGARLGIHAQDDTGCAVANTLAAVEAGATHVQCTANGYGERVGNANLFPVVAALELKYDRRVLPPGALAVSSGPQRNVEGWVGRKRPGTAAAQAAEQAGKAATRAAGSDDHEQEDP